MFFVIYIYKSEPGTQANDHQNINTTFYKGLRLEGTFVSKNLFNLLRRNLSPPEIFLLPKLRLMWHFQNDEQTFTAFTAVSTDISDNRKCLEFVNV